MELKGKKAIVTGASRGIGLAIVRALVSKGATVAGWSRKAPEMQHENFRFFEANVGQEAEVETAFAHSLEWLGGEVDILINNAGLGYFALMEKLTAEQWREMFDVNVHGIYYLTARALPGMKARRRGHIVNIASTAGLEAIPEATGYGATKFAVRGLSQSLYREVKKYDIKVTCVYPGSVNTDFFEHYEGITANDTMLHAADLAASIVHLLETPGNFVPLNFEVRPIHPKYTE